MPHGLPGYPMQVQLEASGPGLETSKPRSRSRAGMREASLARFPKNASAASKDLGRTAGDARRGVTCPPPGMKEPPWRA
jgi:hypothetical protein